jgi:hypothetical protein
MRIIIRQRLAGWRHFLDSSISLFCGILFDTRTKGVDKNDLPRSETHTHSVVRLDALRQYRRLTSVQNRICSAVFSVSGGFAGSDYPL